MQEFQAVTKDENGMLYEVSNKIHIGVTAPDEDYKLLWLDPQHNTIKVKFNGTWVPFSSSSSSNSAIEMDTVMNMPVDYRLIVVNITDHATDQFNFLNVLSAGSACRVVVNYNPSAELLADQNVPDPTKLTITLPTISSYKFIPAETIWEVSQGDCTCFDVVSDGTTMYITNADINTIAKLLEQI